MVRVLEREALQAGVPLLYVEIGRMQMQARAFWHANGMSKVGRHMHGDDCSIQQPEKHKGNTVWVPAEVRHFFDSRCLRFDDTEQWVKQITPEHAHADEGQLVPLRWDLFH